MRCKSITFKQNQLVIELYSSDDNYVVDHFEKTPPMSTFTFGFVISQLMLVNRTDFADPRNNKVCIKVYARPELHKDLENTVSNH